MPSFAKSLSLHRDIQPFAEYAVTPFVGVWIETTGQPRTLSALSVTPFVGVWIETLMNISELSDMRVTPFVGVWIETLVGGIFKYTPKSHPSWVCGLKHLNYKLGSYGQTVTPFVGVWIETYEGSTEHNGVYRHTLRGCVD